MTDLHTVLCDPVFFCDHRVSRIAVYDANDRLIADVRLPAGGAGQDRADTDAGRAILAALGDAGPLTAAELSAASGFSGGWFRAVLAALVASGRVVKDGRRYALPPGLPAGE